MQIQVPIEYELYVQDPEYLTFAFVSSITLSLHTYYEETEHLQHNLKRNLKTFCQFWWHCSIFQSKYIVLKTKPLHGPTVLLFNL